MGATLAARFLIPGPPFYYLTNLTGGGVAIVARIPTNTLGFEDYVFQATETFGLNFPYGYNVEPDGPV